MSSLDLTRDHRGVARITLSRPEVLNAFDGALIADLTDAFGDLGRDSAVRVIVLAAAGRCFCAGADLSWMKRQAQNGPEENLEDARRFAEMMRAIHECPKPTLVRVQGHAFGGGVGLIAAADIAIAVAGSRFAVSEARFGILPAVIGPYINRALGPRQARRLAMTTEQIDAQQALQLGLVHDVVSPEELDAAIERTVSDLLNSGPEALAEIKRLFAEINGHGIDGPIRELTAQTIARVRARDEAREGFAAFFAKRAPRWAPQ